MGAYPDSSAAIRALGAIGGRPIGTVGRVLCGLTGVPRLLGIVCLER